MISLKSAALEYSITYGFFFFGLALKSVNFADDVLVEECDAAEGVGRGAGAEAYGVRGDAGVELEKIAVVEGCVGVDGGDESVGGLFKGDIVGGDEGGEEGGEAGGEDMVEIESLRDSGRGTKWKIRPGGKTVISDSVGDFFRTISANGTLKIPESLRFVPSPIPPAIQWKARWNVLLPCAKMSTITNFK